MEILNLQKIGIEKSVFIGFGVLFIIEQIFYWFLGTYPYRHGLLLRRISFSNLSIPIMDKATNNVKGLALKINDKKQDVYLRYSYPVAIIGPLLFVGQIKHNETNEIRIRIGPFAALFVLYLIMLPILSGGIYGFMNSIIIIALIIWFYIRFYNAIQPIVG